MDYNKINKIGIDGNGNIILQDVNGGNITINYNETEEFVKLVSAENEKLRLQIQKLIDSFDKKQNKIIYLTNKPPSIRPRDNFMDREHHITSIHEKFNKKRAAYSCFIAWCWWFWEKFYSKTIFDKVL